MYPPRGRRGRRHRRFQSRFDAPSFPLFFVGVSPRRQRQRQTSSSRVPRSFPSSSSSSSSSPSWSSKWCRVRALKRLSSLLLDRYPKPFDFCSQIFFSPERERHHHHHLHIIIVLVVVEREREREREKKRKKRPRPPSSPGRAYFSLFLTSLFVSFFFSSLPPRRREKI